MNRFERFDYIKIRWSFNRVVAQSNQMFKIPLAGVDKHRLVTLELTQKLFGLILLSMDVQSNPGPCSVENCSKFSCAKATSRNVNTACL